MTRILVDPDQLRSLSARLQQTTGDLQGVEGRVGSALGGLAWEARQKANVDGQANHARSQARRLAAQAEEMARYLERKAQAFEEADGQGVGGVGQVFGAFTEWVQGAPSWWGFPSQQVNAWWNLGALLGRSSPIRVLRLPVIGGIVVGGLASLTALSMALSEAMQDFVECFQNWRRGKGWKTDEEIEQREGQQRQEEAQKQREEQSKKTETVRADLDFDDMTHDEFIECVGAWANKADKETGVPASVTIAQSILETGWGKSTIGDANNLFGIKGKGPAGSIEVPTKEYVNGKWITVDAKFAKYNSFEESVMKHAELIANYSPYTEAMKHADDPDEFARQLQGVYATDPKYADKLITIMRKYDLYRFDD